MNRNLSQTLLKPIITEKSSALSQQNKYTFKVKRCVSKSAIKKAFEEMFPERKVVSIQTLCLKGHRKRTKSGYSLPRDGKKAIVTASGSKIEYFPDVS